ncbi:hypothetical protein BOC43_28645 [Burkholderia pseudomallei]|nr:hypothetical protein BOC43_28645 [Burkholderia pseudomallei]
MSGLADGAQVTLLNNNADPLTLTANGSFTFTTPVAYGGSYSVTVATQPAGQTCSVASGTGAGSGVTGGISNVNVVCTTNAYPIGGTVSGLADDAQVTLLNNNADPLTLTANGPFSFATPVADGGSYSVTVGTQPAGQTCSVANYSGSKVSARVINVVVTCSTNTYTISGNLSGLEDGAQVTLLNNGTDAQTLAKNGTFTFAAPVAYGGSYAVTVGTQPTQHWQWCTVENGSGTAAANVANVGVACARAQAQVSTVAGSGYYGFVDGPGTSAKFTSPAGIAVDVGGMLYVADQGNDAIRKITPDGTVSTLAGGSRGFVNGQASSAKFSNPRGVALGTGGMLYVADQGNNAIRKITPDGTVSTLAGGSQGFVNGQASSAKFLMPADVAAGTSGTLYVADYGNHAIRKITPDGTVSTLAGGSSGFADGQGTSAKFFGPIGIAVDTSDTLYVADFGNNAIRKIATDGTVSTLAGGGGSGSVDGQGTSAKFTRPAGIVVDTSGTLYVADSGNNAIRKITPDGTVSTLARGLNLPMAIALDSGGTLYVTDTNNNTILKLVPVAPVSP